MMSGDDNGPGITAGPLPPALHDLVEPAIAQFAGGHLDRQPARRRMSHRIKMLDEHGLPVSLPQLPDKRRSSRSLSAPRN